jgi:hypothetical protein
MSSAIFTSRRHPELVSGSIAPHGNPYRFQTQPRRHINPIGVMLIDKVYFPRTMPVFQLLFARNGGGHVSEQFVMDKAIDRISGRVTGRKVVAMLIHTLGQVRRHTNVSRAIGSARKDIDAGLFFFSHHLNNAAKWTLKQVQGDEFFDNQHRLQNQRHPELVSGSIERLGQLHRLMAVR